MKKETIVGRTRLLASWSLILLLGLSIIGAAQDSTWERKTDMPAENSHMGTALVDTKFISLQVMREVQIVFSKYTTHREIPG